MLEEHVAALMAALAERGEQVAHILVTHTHLDHSGAAPLLAARTGARTYGFGPHAQGRHQPEDVVEAGADWKFRPDVTLVEGDTLEGQGYALTALHTPGHCSNHLCFALADGKTLFTGDHVMGWSTSVIAPPDGDMGDYLSNLQRLLARDDAQYLPTHGPAISDPKPLVAAFIQHRHEREAQLIACLRQGVRRISDAVELMYKDVPRYLHPAAARSAFATMLHLYEQGRVKTDGEPHLDGEFSYG
jgi:glyoxylase-like metal-dependent hydrolase (beta-lactamase superfamily II)